MYMNVIAKQVNGITELFTMVNFGERAGVDGAGIKEGFLFRFCSYSTNIKRPSFFQALD